MEREVRLLENRPLADRELAPAVVALVEAVALDALGVRGVGLGPDANELADALGLAGANLAGLLVGQRADRAVRPEQSLNESEGVGFVVVVRGVEN